MKLPKKRYLIGGGLAILIVAGVLLSRGGSQVIYVTEAATRHDLLSTVEATGELKSVTDVSLAFGASGNVGQIAVKVGQVVKSGQVLMTLDRAEQAASLASAQAALDLKFTGASKEEVAISAAHLKSAQVAFDSATAELEVTKARNASQLAEATEALVQAQAGHASGGPLAASSVAAASRDAIIHVRAGIAEADKILGIENNLANTEFKTYLGNEDPNTVDSAKYAFAAAVEARDAAEDLVLELGGAATPEQMVTVRGAVGRSFVATSTLLTYTARVLDATVANSRELSLDDINAFKTAIAAARTSLAGDERSFLTALATYDADIRNDSVVNATNSLATAKANISLTSLQAESAVDARAADLEAAKAEYEKLVAKPRGVDVAGLEAEYQAALARYNDAQIVAPADGRVTALDFDPGERASTGVVAVTMVASTNLFEVTVDIPESDVAKVKIGQTATMSFDAFGEDKVWQATVTGLDPASKTIEGVVYYKATLLLVDGQDVSDLKPGLSANISINVAEKKGAVAIPQRAVLKNAAGASYVRVMTSATTFDERPVTTGVRSDEGFMELVSGVKEGETILLSTKAK